MHFFDVAQDVFHSSGPSNSKSAVQKSSVAPASRYFFRNGSSFAFIASYFAAILNGQPAFQTMNDSSKKGLPSAPAWPAPGEPSEKPLIVSFSAATATGMPRSSLATMGR